MVIVVTPNPEIHDLAMFYMDSACVPYEICKAEKDEYYWLIDSVSLDVDRAIKWAENKMFDRKDD